METRECSYCGETVRGIRDARKDIARDTWTHKACMKEASAIADEIIALAKVGFRRPMMRE